MTKRFAMFVVFAAVILSWAGTASAQIKTWNIDGEARRAILYPPSAKSTAPAPLVFSFHGHGDNVLNFQRTDMHRAWPEAIVVYFQGLPSSDDLYGWQVEKGQDDDRDLKLVDTALASLSKEFNVDPNRIYATGFSNGANFTYLLWAERSQVFAAFAPVAARLRPSVQLKQPKPVFHIAGTEDRQILFADQQKAIETAKRVNGINGKGSSCGDGCTLYSNGRAPVMTWIHPGGHEYPPPTSLKIANFFKANSREDPKAR